MSQSKLLPSSSRLEIYLSRFFDLSFALLTLLLYCWLIVFVAILVSSDETDGDILYWQWRVGKYGEPFKMPKFRTMVPAENVSSNLTDEERITRVGHILRKSNLDELPQLYSVVRGDMTLVGPRPVSLQEHSQLSEQIDHWEKRTITKPGMAGLSQYNGVSTDEPKAMLHYDLKYIARSSLILDSYIYSYKNVEGWYRLFKSIVS